MYKDNIELLLHTYIHYNTCIFIIRMGKVIKTFFFKRFILVLIRYVYINAGAHRGQKASDPLEISCR